MTNRQIGQSDCLLQAAASLSELLEGRAGVSAAAIPGLGEIFAESPNHVIR